jgi:acetate kinase
LTEKITKIKEKITKIAANNNCYNVKVSEFCGKFQLTFEGETTFQLLDSLSKELGTTNINCSIEHIKAVGCRTCNGSYNEQVITIWDVLKVN